jgi:hypothetical protein
MVIQLLRRFAILKEMDALFNTIMMSIVIAGGKVRNLHHDGHDERAFVAFKFAYPINWTQVPFEGMIPDFVCSLTARFIQQALAKLLVEHCLKMVSQLKSLNQQVIRAFNMALVFPLVPNNFTKHVQRHHVTDSFLRFGTPFNVRYFGGPIHYGMSLTLCS